MNSSKNQSIDVALLLITNGIEPHLFLDDMELLVKTDEVGNTLEKSVKDNYDYLQRIDMLLQVELFGLIMSKLTNRYIVTGLDITANTDADTLIDLLMVNGIRIDLLLEYLREKTRAESLANDLNSRLLREIELLILLLSNNNKIKKLC